MSVTEASATPSVANPFSEPLGSPPFADSLEETARFLERHAARKSVSIVVPIFNGTEHVARCLDSLKATVPEGWEIILVDDHSTDPATAPLCEGFVGTRPGARLIKQPQNFGYVVSVNTGIRAAEPANDVVLLNSDTVTPAGWLRKLQLAAAARPGIASVSPLSNAAGVFSVPNAYEDGMLPEGMTVEFADRLLSVASPRRYEDVPVSCGFCMYLRREALSAIGLFDDRLFHRGYGEENDWCERAREAGFIHVVDESCFVAHHHGGSFLGEKGHLKRRNGRLVKALYPEHVATTKQWLASSRLEEVRAAFRDLWAAHGRKELTLPTAPVRLVVEGPSARRAGLDEIVLQIEPRRGQVDAFGLAQQLFDLPAMSELTRIIARLVVRWDVASAEVSADLRAHLDPRLGALGVATLTTTGAASA